MNNPQEQPSEPMQVKPVRVALRLPAEKPTVTYIILGVTIAVYLAQMASQQLLGYDIPAEMGMKVNDLIMKGEVWRLFTPVLLHGNIAHIGFNMYALYAFGRGLERAYGHWRYFLLYMLGAFAGNVASFLRSDLNSLGASTAVFGLVAAQGVYFFQNRRIYGGQAISVLANVGFIIVIDLYLGSDPNSGIDNWGHLGGLLGGILFALLAGPLFVIEGYPPDVRLTDKRGGMLPWLVAAVEGAGIALIATLKSFIK